MIFTLLATIGGAVAAVAKAAGLIFIGVLIYGSSADDAETRGYKRGQANASKSYEAKLKTWKPTD